MKFSIVIPNLNSTIINQTLNSLEKQNYSKGQFEVIVVGLDEPGLVQTSALVKFDQTERKYAPAEARNRGARQARGEILIFLDSDCVSPPNWLNILERDFNLANIIGIGGGVCFDKTNYWNTADNFSLFHEFLETQPAGMRQQLPSLNFAIRKDIFFKFHGFDESYPFPAGEDFDLTYRITDAGNALLFDPEAWVRHLPERNSMHILWRHSYTIGQYSTKVSPKHTQQPGVPALLRHRSALILISPILALGVTLRIYLTTPKSFQYWQSLPAVFLSKIAWCAGAANSPHLSGKR